MLEWKFFWNNKFRGEKIRLLKCPEEQFQMIFNNTWKILYFLYPRCVILDPGWKMFFYLKIYVKGREERGFFPIKMIIIYVEKFQDFSNTYKKSICRMMLFRAETRFEKNIPKTRHFSSLLLTNQNKPRI